MLPTSTLLTLALLALGLAALAALRLRVRLGRVPSVSPQTLREGLLQVLALGDHGHPAADVRLLEDGESPVLEMAATPWRLRLWSAAEEAAVAPPAAEREALVVLGGAQLRPGLAQRAGQPVFHLVPGQGAWIGARGAAPGLERLLALALARLRRRLQRGSHPDLLPDERAALRAPLDPALARWASAVRWSTPLATEALLALLAAVFALETLWGDSTATATLHAMGALTGDALRSGEVWRLLAAASLHIGLPHLLANGFALFSFGRHVEAILGSARFVLLYVLAALGGSLASTLMSGSSARVAAGASGALWGLMTALLALGFERRHLLPPPVRSSLRANGLRLLVLNGLISLHPAVDWAAHLGGGLVGFVLVASHLLTAGLAERDEQRLERFWRWAAGLAIAALVGSLLVASWAGRPWDLARPPAQWRRHVVAGTALSIELPPGWRLSAMGRAATEATKATTYTTGPFGLQPLTLVLWVSSAELPAHIDARELLAGWEREAQSRPLAAGARRIAARRTEVGDRPFLYAEYALARGRERTWIGLAGRRAVRLDVFDSQESPPTWRAAGERFVASLRDAAR